MSPKSTLTDEPYRARVPADVDAPDKVLYGLTFRQLAVLAVAAVLFYGGWQALRAVLAVPVLLGAVVVLGGLVFGLAVGRRDGLPMDVWLLAAVRHSRQPRALSTTGTTARAPEWVQAPAAKVILPAPLNLPADAVDEHGEIRLAGTRAAMVAATSVNLALRTADEQAALIDTFGRWLTACPRRRRSSCRHSRSTCTRPPAPSPPPSTGCRTRRSPTRRPTTRGSSTTSRNAAIRCAGRS
jgi:hypothetical protein